MQTLESEQSEDDLHRERAAINKISIEEVWILLRRIPINFEDVAQVKELL